MDLETKLRDMMDRRIDGIGARSMPPGTVARVRRRRARGVAVVTVVAIAFAAGLTGLIRITANRPTSRPAAEVTVAIPPATEPGVTYVTPAPFANLGPGEWPHVRLGGVDVPYVDREEGEEATLSTDKVAIASGYVEGVEWSMTAFGVDHPDSGTLGWETCGELFLADMGDDGGVRFCTNVLGEPGQRDLRIAGASFGMGPVTAYTGIVSDKVESVVFAFADGSRTSADLIDGHPEVGSRYFVLFVPNDAAGRVVAREAVGSPVATEPLCVRDVAPQEEVTACGNGVAWVASAVSSEPH